VGCTPLGDRAPAGHLAHARGIGAFGGRRAETRPEPHPPAVPKDCDNLVESGPYAIVRHPIYSGLIIDSLGWALWVNGWLTIVYALLLFAFFDIKSRLEERWLEEKFGQPYEEYRTRVRKLIPWVY